ncbi:hypothetical protein KAU33_15860 [Candidatus Dependentiae bacterium]|nr:hypothetical protein [Candidatus Dependentiae bacterium]
MKVILSHTERVKRSQKLDELKCELENKYPLFREFNLLQKWDELLEYYIFHEDNGLKKAFLGEYERAIKIFSGICVHSKPISLLSPINCKVFVSSIHETGEFRGWACTVQEDNNDYVIVRFRNVSKLIHKNDAYEIYNPNNVTEQDQ